MSKPTPSSGPEDAQGLAKALKENKEATQAVERAVDDLEALLR
ncbi:hypothetical protein [Variovorax boronicumulans]|nr:hypothetical protein [Variovorax boronicumulans]